MSSNLLVVTNVSDIDSEGQLHSLRNVFLGCVCNDCGFPASV